MTQDVYHESASFFDDNYLDQFSLLPLQVEPTAPQVTGLESATGMALADRAIRDRLAHFPDNLYDLRDSSHLMRLMKVLLGDAGAGQLRKRNLIVQFQSAMQGTHFYDLDRFYGSIFGVTRSISEILGINPTTDLATANEWDQIQDADASFRDRIYHLASAINLGATYPGIQAAAEALTNVECDVYEVWDLLDTYGPGGPGRSWDDIEDLDADSSLPTWSDVENMDTSPVHPTWTELEAITTIGRTGTNSRAEVIVVPKKDYDRIQAEQGQAEADRQRAEDEHSIIRVLEKIKPASVLLTVDPDGIAVHTDAPMANLTSDSDYWAVMTRTAPRPTLVSPDGSPYPLSLQQEIEGILSGELREIPKPPWSIQQAAAWSYAPEVVGVKSYTFRTGADDDLNSPGDGPIVDKSTDDYITYKDGTHERFTADRGVLDPRRALAARYASEGILVSHPYSGDRVTA